MAKTIAVLSQKGGTGKTTTVRSLADLFTRAGMQVLAVDLDPQRNLSDWFEVPVGARPTVADVLSDRARMADALHGPIVPANRALNETQRVLGERSDRHGVLRRALADVKYRYDLVLIDCPPSLGLLTVNALAAADYALVTSQAHYFSLQGVAQVADAIALVREDMNPDLEWLGVFLNLVDLRTLHSRRAVAELPERFGDKAFRTVVRQSIRYSESAERRLPIVTYSPRVAADYLALADEVLERLGLSAQRTWLRGWRARLGASAA